MKTLAPKHEIFAQEMANGANASEAYRTAYGRNNRRYAAELGHRPDIVERIQDILDEKAKIERDAAQMAAEALSIDKQWVMKALVENVNVGLGRVLVKGPILGRAGDDPRDVEFMDRDPSAANRALELLGKELGMFIDRSEISTFAHDVSDKPLSADEWATQHALTTH